MQSIPGAFVEIDRIEFSPAGTTALLYSESRQRVQVITHLPESSQVTHELDLSSLSLPVVSLAVADSGALILAGVSDGERGEIYRITSDNAITSIHGGWLPSALRFLPDGDTALACDRELNQVLLVSGIGETPVVTQLAGSEEGANAPGHIELLRGGKTVVVANTKANSLLLIDLEKSTTSLVPIPASATDLKAMRQRGGIAITTSDPPAFWYLGDNTDTPVLSFIADMTAIASKR
jgi:hypothetical protein